MGLALAALAYPVTPLPPPRTDAVEPRTRSGQFSAESVPYHRRPHPLVLTGCSRLGLVTAANQCTPTLAGRYTRPQPPRDEDDGRQAYKEELDLRGR